MMITTFLAQIRNPILTTGVQQTGGWQFIETLARNVIGIGFIVGVVVFFFVFAIGAIQWLTAGGDRGALEDARRKIINAIVGLLILLLLYIFIQFINLLFGLNIGNLGTLYGPPPGGATPTAVVPASPTLSVPTPTSVTATPTSVCALSGHCGFIPCCFGCNMFTSQCNTALPTTGPSDTPTPFPTATPTLPVPTPTSVVATPTSVCALSGHCGFIPCCFGCNMFTSQCNTALPTTGPSDTPTPFPTFPPPTIGFATPTPSNMMLNSGLNVSCYNLCRSSGFAGCASVGTDFNGSNGLYYDGFLATCTILSADCNLVMYSASNVCGGFNANWTRCFCN